MTRILQYLVWITVMMTSARTQRGYSYSYLQNPRSISFPDTRTHDDYEHLRNRPSEQRPYSDLQDPRRQRIQNRVSEIRRTENGLTSRIQISKRGGHRKHYLTKLFLELFAALGALDSDISSAVVFPGPTSKSRFEPEISEECKKLGYCKSIPNYPKEDIKELIGTLGNDLRQRFQMDELDTAITPQAVQRFGSDGLSFGLCNATEEILVLDSLPDKNGKWWTLVQDRDNNMTQGFRAETCQQRDSGCISLVSFPPGYNNKCEQKYVYRTMLIAVGDRAFAQKSLRLPSCCSCMITAFGS